jgi:hypothetical protein
VGWQLLVLSSDILLALGIPNRCISPCSPLGESPRHSLALTLGGTYGSQPYGSLALDSKGNLYGTTYSGGNLNDCDSSFGCRIVFEVRPNGREPILSVFTGRANGSWPLAGVVRDKKGNLYGTAAGGGAGEDCCGVVFEVTRKGIENVLYTFTGGSDGSDPDTDLTMDSKGNLYGGAQGGSNGSGVIYQVTP